MYSQCPECLTVYKLAANVLAAGHGIARCGYCAATFDALRTLTEQLPPEPIERLQQHQPAAEPPQLHSPILRPKGVHAEDEVASQQAPLPLLQDRVGELGKWAAPAFAKSPRQPKQSRTWPWALGTLALIFSFTAELAYAKREWLFNDPTVRPWLDIVCAKTSCRLPARNDPNKFELISRDIRPHPSVPEALIISATLRNAANFTQAFPVIEISLSDLDENRVGMRRFQPREYITDSKTLARGMLPDTTAALTFEIADPGKNAIAFEFKFF